MCPVTLRIIGDLHIYLITLIASRNLYDVSDKHANEHNINLVMRLHLRNYFELKCLRESNETFVGPPMQTSSVFDPKEKPIFFIAKHKVHNCFIS